MLGQSKGLFCMRKPCGPTLVPGTVGSIEVIWKLDAMHWSSEMNMGPESTRLVEISFRTAPSVGKSGACVCI